MLKTVGNAMDFVNGAKGNLVKEAKGIIDNGIDLPENLLDALFNMHFSSKLIIIGIRVDHVF